ncbi:MAG: hypothetical protein ACJ0HF_02260 [Candidatus Thalassarchaeum sp.]|nr:hypothetical protein [Euryarchaeota archaeon]|tara:strand:+ start:260 stop:1069 length:810 start_codon:yes stop_codon:yes gene_type:complete
MAEAIAFPSLPPASPWDAYLLILIIPFMLRLIFVMPPLIDLVNTYAPPGERTKHLKWFSERLRKLPIEGFWLIVINEILSFLLPAIIAITARIWFGPIGWPSWNETPDIGVTLLLIAGAAWIITDFSKVTRSRRGIQLLAKYNLTTAKAAVQAAVVGREILKGVGEIEVPRPWRDVIDVEHTVDGEHVPAPPDGPLQRLKHHLFDIVADFAETTIEQVRGPAGEAMDKFDEDIQRRLTERVRASSRSLLNNVVFSTAPLLVLAGLQRLV